MSKRNFDGDLGKSRLARWTFILDNFDIFDIYITWDVGIGIDLGGIDVEWEWNALPHPSVHVDPPSTDVDVFPNIDIVADFNLIVDFWWNNQVKVEPPKIPLLPTPGVSVWLDPSLTINEVKDYVNQNPIHLWGPVTGDPAITWDLDWDFKVDGWDWDTLSVELDIIVDLTIDVPGFHRMWDHPTLYFP